MRKVARKKDAEAKRTGLAARKDPAKKSGGKTEAKLARRRGSAKTDVSSRRRTRQVIGGREEGGWQELGGFEEARGTASPPACDKASPVRNRSRESP